MERREKKFGLFFRKKQPLTEQQLKSQGGRLLFWPGCCELLLNYEVEKRENFHGGCLSKSLKAGGSDIT